MAYLKTEMIQDEDKPFLKTYFVDVELARSPEGKITHYRIVGFHGKEGGDE
jgi:hypothetical protein